MTFWRYRRYDFCLPPGDPLLAPGLPLLLATSNLAEAGWRRCRGDQYLGGPGRGRIRSMELVALAICRNNFGELIALPHRAAAAMEEISTC